MEFGRIELTHAAPTFRNGDGLVSRDLSILYEVELISDEHQGNLLSRDMRRQTSAGQPATPRATLAAAVESAKRRVAIERTGLLDVVVAVADLTRSTCSRTLCSAERLSAEVRLKMRRKPSPPRMSVCRQSSGAYREDQDKWRKR